MAAYRYLLADLLGGQTLAEVPFTSASFEHVLNAPGNFEGTLALKQPPALHLVLAPLFPHLLGRLALYVERDGVIVWGGIPWTSDPDLDAGTMTIRGEGWLSYLRRRVLRATKVYTQVDQTTEIAKNLIDWALAYGPSPPIDTTAVGATGVPRDRTWQAYERPWIGRLIEDLAAVENGFDFRFDSAWSAGAIVTRFLTSYPNTGRSTNLVFEIGTQVTSAALGCDGTALATHVDAVGAGEGDLGLLASVANPGMLAAGWPVLDDVISAGDVSVFATLDAKARHRLARGSAPITLPRLSVAPEAEPTFGSYSVGDVVTIRGGAGLATLDGRYRLVGVGMSIDAAGGEVAQLATATLDAFQEV